MDQTRPLQFACSHRRITRESPGPDRERDDALLTPLVNLISRPIDALHPCANLAAARPDARPVGIDAPGGLKKINLIFLKFIKTCHYDAF